jgi:hypothetical protein
VTKATTSGLLLGFPHIIQHNISKIFAMKSLKENFLIKSRINLEC